MKKIRLFFIIIALYNAGQASPYDPNFFVKWGIYTLFENMGAPTRLYRVRPLLKVFTGMFNSLCNWESSRNHTMILRILKRDNFSSRDRREDLKMVSSSRTYHSRQYCPSIYLNSSRFPSVYSHTFRLTYTAENRIV